MTIQQIQASYLGLVQHGYTELLLYKSAVLYPNYSNWRCVCRRSTAADVNPVSNRCRLSTCLRNEKLFDPVRRVYTLCRQLLAKRSLLLDAARIRVLNCPTGRLG